MVRIFGVYGPNFTLCVSLMKIGEKKWAVNFRHFRPETKKLQVSESADTEKWKIFKKSSETPGSIHNFVPHQKLSNFDSEGGGSFLRSKICYPTFWFWVECKWSQVDPRSVRCSRAILWKTRLFEYSNFHILPNRILTSNCEIRVLRPKLHG